VAPEQLAAIQAQFAQDWLAITVAAQRGQLPKPADRRFTSSAWTDNPVFLLNAHAYLLSSRAMMQMVDAAQVAEPVKERLRFAAMQWIEASSPANYVATNPDVQQAFMQSKGQSLCDGIRNLFGDIQKGRLTQSDESQFEIGRNVGVTPGSVVYENRLMQLIQYAPSTPKVHARPLLIVPPCINKFYILDLQPENSLVKHAVDSGQTVFLVSWRNPLATDTDGIESATWDEYLDEGVLQALSVVADISRQRQVNALGFCVGGTLLSCALALASARGDDPVASLTLLTTPLDFSDVGVLGVFVDEQHAQVRDQQLGNGGLMTARELGTTFSFLRPGELVWNYVVGNYLKGEKPKAFDLLYWNADGTNLPGPFFSWYFRNTYLENNLKKPGRVVIDDKPLDLGSLTMPTYIYGSRDDHIVSWQTAYASTHLLGGPVRFVLGASGHIAGVINPPAKNKRCFWAQDADIDKSRAPQAEAWLEDATEQPGSWWPDWLSWLQANAGNVRNAPTKQGSARFPVIEPAPGRYVKVRA
jgi:polyhydroxyalkanoate synthase